MNSRYWLIVIAVLLFYCIYSVLIPQALFSDSAWGMLTAKSMENGAPFNHYIEPVSDDISKDNYVFQTWWTPGQYLLPALIKKSIPVKTGTSILLITFLSGIIGIWGLQKLYKFWGFSSSVIGIAIIFIVCQRSFSFPFTYYHGGEVLLFGILPWLYYLMLKSAEYMNWSNVLFFVCLCLVGFLFKSSMLISLIAIVMSLFIIYLNNEIGIEKFRLDQIAKLIREKKLINYSLMLFAILALTCIPAYVLFLSKGTNPSTPHALSVEAMDIIFPLVSPLTAAFSFDDIINRIFAHPTYNYNFQINLIWFYFPLSFLFFVLLYRILRNKSIQRDYKIVLVSTGLIFIPAFLYFYSFDSNISFESRHFRILGLIFLPAALHLGINNKKMMLRIGTYTMLVAISVYGIAGFVNRKNYINENYTLNDDGYFMEIKDRQAFDFLKKLDRSTNDEQKLIYVYSPEIALQLKSSRYISSHANYQNLSLLASKTYDGKAGTVYLFLPKTFEADSRMEVITNSFTDYSEWQEVYDTPNYIFLAAHN